MAVVDAFEIRQWVSAVNTINSTFSIKSRRGNKKQAEKEFCGLSSSKQMEILDAAIVLAFYSKRVIDVVSVEIEVSSK